MLWLSASKMNLTHLLPPCVYAFGLSLSSKSEADYVFSNPITKIMECDF